MSGSLVVKSRTTFTQTVPARVSLEFLLRVIFNVMFPVNVQVFFQINSEDTILNILTKLVTNERYHKLSFVKKSKSY